MKNYINKNTGILIRIDDVCENMDWKLMKKLEVLFDTHSIKPVLGVIPNNKDEGFLSFPRNDNFWDQVRKWQGKGWEIVQHGNTHIFMTNFVKRNPIISIMEADQSFLGTL